MFTLLLILALGGMVVWFTHHFLITRERTKVLSSLDVSHKMLIDMEHAILNGVGFRNNIRVLRYLGSSIDIAVNRGVIPLLERGERPENSTRAAILLIAVRQELKNRENWEIETLISETSVPAPKP